MTSDNLKKSTPMLIGGLGAILACCLGPLVLVGLGFSGAWLGNLTRLAPYRPWFLGAALLALVFAGKRIYRPADVCKPGELCAVAQPRRISKTVFWIAVALVLLALGFPFVAKLFY